MLQKIKLLLGISDTSKDQLLNLLIRTATDNICSYCHLDSIPKELENCACQMVVIDYNKLGSEGLESEDYSGVSYSYLTVYPEPIINQLKAHRKLRVF